MCPVWTNMYEDAGGAHEPEHQEIVVAWQAGVVEMSKVISDTAYPANAPPSGDHWIHPFWKKLIRPPGIPSSSLVGRPRKLVGPPRLLYRAKMAP